MSRAGRPSGYISELHVPWAKSLARRGLTVKEIADEFGVAKSTLCKWVAENSELSDALNEGRSMADAKVENSLYRRAIGGFTVTEKKTIVHAGADGTQKPARVEIVEKEIPPDTTACLFWLKNRMPLDWRDQKNIAVQTAADNEVKGEIEKAVSEFLKGRGQSES